MRKKILVLSLVVAVAVGVVVFTCLARHKPPSYDPASLRRARWYSWTAPRFFDYCRVPLGVSKASIIRRFGAPSFMAVLDDPVWRAYVRRRTLAGWSTPPHDGVAEVLVYEVVQGSEMIVVYYYFDRAGRLKRTFVSET